MTLGAKLRLIDVLLAGIAAASVTGAILIRTIPVRLLLLTLAAYLLLAPGMVLYGRLRFRLKFRSRNKRGLCVICARPRPETPMVCSPCAARYPT